jgi:ABC-type multidrug transport system fused ATPase/permease subunit
MLNCVAGFIPAEYNRDKKNRQAKSVTLIISHFSILLNNLTIHFMSKILALIIFCTLLLNGCTIEKRKYSSGYHTTWNVQHLFPKGNSANQFQQEESKLSLTPKPHSKNESALHPIFPDSIEKQESGEQGPLSIDSKHKQHRPAPSISDTVPKVKKKEQELPNTIELKDQLQIDKKLVAHSWLVLLISAVTFIGSIAMLLGTDFEFAFVLLTLGGLGGIVSIILIIAFTLLKNKHKNQIKLNQKRHELAINPSNLENHKSKKEIEKRLAEIDQILKKLKTVRIISGILSILTLSPLFPVGIASLVVFLIATSRRNKLNGERYLLPYQEGETLTKPPISEEEKNLLQKRLDKLTRKIRIIKILITTSAIIALMLLLFLLTSGYSSAAIGALEIFILLLLLFMSIQIIQRNKKAKIEDRLNTTR